MLKIKDLGLKSYQSCYQQMQDFTANRDATTPDQIWLVEHPPVFTQGLNGKPEHLLTTATSAPVVQTDRGGQITYHAPGQLIAYLLIDLQRREMKIRDLVSLMENAVIDFLQEKGIKGVARADAPGIYIEGKKIASLGLKIKKYRSYHGLALNVDLDLSPFAQINPCGLVKMQMTKLTDFYPTDIETTKPGLVAALTTRLEKYPIISDHFQSTN